MGSGTVTRRCTTTVDKRTRPGRVPEDWDWARPAVLRSGIRAAPHPPWGSRFCRHLKTLPQKRVTDLTSGTDSRFAGWWGLDRGVLPELAGAEAGLPVGSGTATEVRKNGTEETPPAPGSHERKRDRACAIPSIFRLARWGKWIKGNAAEEGYGGKGRRQRLNRRIPYCGL